MYIMFRLLKILTMVVIEPGNSFKSFTPSIIVFAIEQIYPIVSEVSEWNVLHLKQFHDFYYSVQRSSPEVKGAIFDLLRHLLLRRYRYFFPSQMIASMLVDGTLNSKAATISHKPQFLSIMSVRTSNVYSFLYQCGEVVHRGKGFLYFCLFYIYYVLFITFKNLNINFNVL